MRLVTCYVRRAPCDWHAACPTKGMATRHPRDLRCCQLADQLRTQVVAICERPAAASDRRFCDQFRAAAGSACRNLAEGFRRFTSPAIVQFFDYALGSLGEIQDCLQESLTRRIITPEEFVTLSDLVEHARAAALNFSRPHRRAGRNGPQPGRRRSS